jgi:hypothetical protein
VALSFKFLQDHLFTPPLGALNGAPDSPVRQPRHPTVRFWPLELLSSGPPDSPVVHQTVNIHYPVRLLALLWLLRVQARIVAHLLFVADDRCRCVAVTPLAHRTVRWIIAKRLPDFPKVASSESGSLVHRTVRCARPGHTSVVFCSLCLNPFLVFLLVCCEPLAPVKLII